MGHYKVTFEPGELIIYQCGDRFQIGKVKRIVEDGAFVYYSDGDTASKTPFENMHKIDNWYTIKETSLGKVDSLSTNYWR